MSSTQVAEPLLGDRERTEIYCVEYRPDIDGLRAVAALAVIGVHAGIFPGGGLGVDVFFVISGFLISRIILRELQRERFSLLDFYARRVKRIFPALIALLIAVSGVGWLVLSPAEYRQLANDIAAGAGFIANFLFYFTVDDRTRTAEYLLGHLWTLGVEEQFYLLWPLFLLVGWRLGRKLSVQIALMTALSFASYVLMNADHGLAWLLPWNRLWQLLLGGALAYSQLNGPAQLKRILPSHATQIAIFSRLPLCTILAIIGTALIILPITGIGIDSYGIWGRPSATLGTLLLISAGSQPWINRHILGTRLMVFIGLLSYPLYLWHLSIFVFAAILEGRFEMADYGYKNMASSTKTAAAILSFVLAYATYKYIEQPIRSSSRTKSIAAALCIAMALCVGAVYAVSR